jgi:protein-S-isoprenylcysteine O-methyltransferase Ste14
MCTLELKIPPVAVFLAFAAAMWLIPYRIPTATNFYFSFRMPISLIMTFAGAFFAVAGIFAFRKSHTTVNPIKPETASKIVANGVYRFSRNPMYVGLLFVLAALAVWLCSPLAFLFLPAFVMYMNRFQILPEERALRAKFGSEFNAYKMSVRRWL